MIYSDYKVKFYKNSRTGEEPVLDYLEELRLEELIKVNKYIEYLRINNGYLDEPYSRHLIDKIRELRVDFANNLHRILYFTFSGRKIILLHAFLKKSDKTPSQEIKRAQINYIDFINNPNLYG